MCFASCVSGWCSLSHRTVGDAPPGAKGGVERGTCSVDDPAGFLGHASI
jgi:hypothetical protein